MLERLFAVARPMDHESAERRLTNEIQPGLVLVEVSSLSYSVKDFDSVTKSEGIISTVVLLFSAPTSTTICMRGSSRAAGLPAGQ
jgi:hypothetical protein